MAAPEVIVRPARPADCNDLAALAAELRTCLGDPPDALTPERFRSDGFGSTREFEVVVAHADGALVGYALFTPAYETAYAAPGLYLSDLYVRPSARRNGIARSLVDCVCEIARQRERRFVWWVCDPENEQSEKFYNALPPTNQKLVRARALVLDTPHQR